MNKKQLSEHIGNIDDRLVQQAEKIPNYAAQHRKKRIKTLIAAAAAIVLMVSSFSAGGIFTRKVIAEVSVEQETLELDGVDLTLVLPNSWHGKYSMTKDGQNYIIYIPQIRESSSKEFDLTNGGILFTIVCYDEAMTEKQFIENGLDFTAYHYLLATNNKTYILHYASDVQWNPEDKEQEKIYTQMSSEIKDIQFVVTPISEE